MFTTHIEYELKLTFKTVLDLKNTRIQNKKVTDVWKSIIIQKSSQTVDQMMY